jgi:thymidylate kinase
MEQESFWFRRKVDDGYRELAKRFPERIIEIDASKPKRAIFSAIRSHVQSLLNSDRPQKAAATLLACS